MESLRLAILQKVQHGITFPKKYPFELSILSRPADGIRLPQNEQGFCQKVEKSSFDRLNSSPLVFAFLL